MGSDYAINPREHIKQIRSDFNNSSKRVKDSFNKSIHELATGIYSKDPHFIFELIQNAEDNTYSNTEPSLTFRLLSIDPTRAKRSNGVLVIENNETGFLAENVEAICNCISTKSKIQGYIGEKGIGFKSVFRVTSNPHIFSNGYRFCLPEHDEETGFGYIVPRWVDEIPQGIDLSKTTIVLPLDKVDFGYEKIERLLKDIEPETILFLSKLKKIQIKTERGHELTISKDDSKKGPLVRILIKNQGEDKATKENFLLYKKTFPKPREINPEKRKGINDREVSIAFPLTQDNDKAGKVFAYLPVRSGTGLPFLINADFLLPSSREDIMNDEPWNQWLRDSVSEVFVEAFEKWLNNSKYRTQLYGFIPLEAHMDFFKPVVKSIQEQLTDREIILTEPDGKKCRPRLTRTAPKDPKGFRSLLSSNKYPKTLLETRLVLGELEAYKEQLKVIGVTPLTPEEVKRCLHDRSWIKRQNYDWLLKCYQYLSSKKFENLTNCPIVPVEADSGIKLSFDNEQPIYFECNEQGRQILDEVPNCVRVPLAFLDRRFFEKIKDDAKIKSWMTDSLRIYPFSKNKYGVDVIGWFKKNYKEIPESDFVSTTYFLSQFVGIEDNLKSIPILLADSRRMLLSEALSSPGIQAVVTPEALDPETGWQNIFAQQQDRSHLFILSDSYIIPNQEADSVEKLKKLWDKINVTRFPWPFKYEGTECSTGLSEYERKCYQNTGNSSSVKSISNYRPPIRLYNFKILEISERNKVAISLAHWLSEQNQNNISWQNAYVNGFYYKRWWNDFISEFLYFLKNNPWLPTTKGSVCPNQAFLPLPQIKEDLGETVPYFEGMLPDNMVTLLGIRKQATAEVLVSVLDQQSQKGIGSKEFAERVYRHLSSLDLSSNKAVLQRLKQSKVIFLPGDSASQWISAKDNVVWDDRSDVWGNDFFYLGKIYPKLKEFFLQTIGIKEDVDTECFAQRWLKLQKETGRDNNEIERILTTIYQKIRPICEMAKDKPPQWWQKFSSEALVWTQGNTFEKSQPIQPELSRK